MRNSFSKSWGFSNQENPRALCASGILPQETFWRASLLLLFEQEHDIYENWNWIRSLGLTAHSFNKTVRSMTRPAFFLIQHVLFKHINHIPATDD